MICRVKWHDQIITVSNRIIKTVSEWQNGKKCFIYSKLKVTWTIELE